MVPRLTIRPGIIVDPSLVEDRRGRWRSHGGGVNQKAVESRRLDVVVIPAGMQGVEIRHAIDP